MKGIEENHIKVHWFNIFYYILGNEFWDLSDIYNKKLRILIGRSISGTVSPKNFLGLYKELEQWKYK